MPMAQKWLKPCASVLHWLRFHQRQAICHPANQVRSLTQAGCAEVSCRWVSRREMAILPQSANLGV
jgi:hypothetical protein